MKFIRENKDGFTLIETVGSMVVLSIVSILIFTLIIISINAEKNYEKKIRRHIYLDSSINFIENHLDGTINSFQTNGKNLMLGTEKNKDLIEIKLENNFLVTNKKVEMPRFKIDDVEFKKSGELVYVTVKLEGDEITRCLELKSNCREKEIFQ